MVFFLERIEHLVEQVTQRLATGNRPFRLVFTSYVRVRIKFAQLFAIVALYRLIRILNLRIIIVDGSIIEDVAIPAQALLRTVVKIRHRMDEVLLLFFKDSITAINLVSNFDSTAHQLFQPASLNGNAAAASRLPHKGASHLFGGLLGADRFETLDIRINLGHREAIEQVGELTMSIKISQIVGRIHPKYAVVTRSIIIFRLDKSILRPQEYVSVRGSLVHRNKHLEFSAKCIVTIDIAHRTTVCFSPAI